MYGSCGAAPLGTDKVEGTSSRACTWSEEWHWKEILIDHGAPCAVQAALGADKVTFEQGVYLDNYGADWQMENAAKACDGADAAVIFLGLSSIKDHRIPKPDFLQVDESWARPTHCALMRCLTRLPYPKEGATSALSMHVECL